MLDRGANGPLDIRCDPAVGLDRQRLAAVCPDIGHQRLGLRCGCRIGEGHGGAFQRQSPHNGSADTARATGDQGSLADKSL
ncbi:hypothetical protein D3C84_677170 [compost metagenome]